MGGQKRELLKSAELGQDLPPRRGSQMAFKLISTKFVNY